MQEHENPFVLILLVPKFKSQHWPEPENEELLINAFDRFQNNSAFFSLLPNQQNRNVYTLLTNIDYKFIDAEIRLGDTSMFYSKSFQLKELTNYSVLLEQVKIGTRFRKAFYRMTDNHCGLFMKIYYIVYREHIEKHKSVLSFRAGTLGELAAVMFKPTLLHNKVVVSDPDNFFKICFGHNLGAYLKNEYRVYNCIPDSDLYISFGLEENKDQQFQVLIDDAVPEEEATFKIEQLEQVGQKVYLFRKDSLETLTIEVPTYFFGHGPEPSKLVVPFTLVAERSKNESPRVHISLEVYDLRQKVHHVLLNAKSNYHLDFEHFVEDRNVSFRLVRVVDLKAENKRLSPIEVTKTIFTTKSKEVVRFINGAVIYDREFATTSTGLKNWTDKRDGSTRSKKSDKRYVITVVCLMTTLVLLLGCFLKWRKKKVIKRKRFVKSN